MKIVINDCHGGFSLSAQATQRYAELKGKKCNWRGCRDVDRNDPILIKVVEEMGNEADGEYASLKIIDIPDDVKWQIEEYDGMEWIAEKHRTWR